MKKEMYNFMESAAELITWMSDKVKSEEGKEEVRKFALAYDSMVKLLNSRDVDHGL